MNVLICGSRDFYFEKPVKTVIDGFPHDTVIIEGGAPGADSVARKLAEQRGLRVLEFKADWKTHGRAAGPIRNQKMLNEGQPAAVYAFYTRKDASLGTKNMVELARKAGVTVIEYDFWQETGRDTITVDARYSLSSSFIIGDVLKAKGGDRDAVQRVINKMASAEYLQQVRRNIGDPANVVYVPVVESKDHPNPLPTAFAHHLADKIGGNVIEDALFYKKMAVKRRTLSRWERMTSHREFVVMRPEELKDKRVVLVDDQFTTGGTLRDAYVQLRNEGINVSNIVCLGKSHCSEFLVNKAAIDDLQDKFTSQDLQRLENLTGVNLYDLTQAEANLLNMTGMAKVFDRLDQAYSKVHAASKLHEIEEAAAGYGVLIHNRRALEICEEDRSYAPVKLKMEQASTLLNEDPTLTSGQKAEIAAVLSDDKYCSVWFKETLSPACTLAVGKLLSKQVAEPYALKDLSQEDSRFVHSVTSSFNRDLMM